MSARKQRRPSITIGADALITEKLEQLLLLVPLASRYGVARASLWLGLTWFAAHPAELMQVLEAAKKNAADGAALAASQGVVLKGGPSS